MRKVLGICLALIMLIVPMAMAYVTQPMPLQIGLGTEPYEPNIWGCDHWVMSDDPYETGRISESGTPLIERMQSYIFTGEQIHWLVLVLDKNGIEKVLAPDGTVGGLQEVNCQKVQAPSTTIMPSCNARILEEELTVFNPDDMAYYDCWVTAEPGMHGSMPITVQVTDLLGKSGVLAETLTYFFNPAISLTVNGAIDFGQNVRPGTMAYSPTIGITSASEGGVVLDMFIAGKDFYDSAHSGAMCPTTNSLALSAFSYQATNGAYSTAQEALGNRRDAEGYVPIRYCIGAECPFTRAFYDTREIIQGVKGGPGNAYYLGNELVNGGTISMTFRLALPEPCNGNFNSGGFYVMGEAI